MVRLLNQGRLIIQHNGNLYLDPVHYVECRKALAQSISTYKELMLINRHFQIYKIISQ